MGFQVWGKTDKGLKRENNQDSFRINEKEKIFIVADGMGGHSGGEIASQMAVDIAEEIIRQRSNSMPIRELMTKAYEEASQRIYDFANSGDRRLVGMGTTMVLLYFAEGSLFIGNVGDSRAYLYRDGKLWQVTEDHSLMNEQLRSGAISEDQIKNFVGKNVITRSVGYEREVYPDVLERPISEGDCFLICSDGFSGLVEDKDIEQILNNTESEQVVDVCIDRALKNGGHDNVTVVFLKYMA